MIFSVSVIFAKRGDAALRSDLHAGVVGSIPAEANGLPAKIGISHQIRCLSNRFWWAVLGISHTQTARVRFFSEIYKLTREDRNSVAAIALDRRQHLSSACILYSIAHNITSSRPPCSLFSISVDAFPPFFQRSDLFGLTNERVVGISRNFVPSFHFWTVLHRVESLHRK